MAAFARRDVYQIIEMRDGAVYASRKLGSIWITMQPRTAAEEDEIAQQYGGDMLASTIDTYYGSVAPWQGLKEDT